MMSRKVCLHVLARHAGWRTGLPWRFFAEMTERLVRPVPPQPEGNALRGHGVQIQ